MTILTGKVTKAEGTDIIDEMNIDGGELLDTLSSKNKQQLVTVFNDIATDYSDTDQVDSFEELPEFVFNNPHEWLEHIPPSSEQLAVKALDERERQYVHLVDTALSTTFHTVVELPE